MTDSIKEKIKAIKQIGFFCELTHKQSIAVRDVPKIIEKLQAECSEKADEIVKLSAEVEGLRKLIKEHVQETGDWPLANKWDKLYEEKNET